ncbi:hypothetical protein KAR91_15670 [Candidatus Pacearchaeota archaeon]|nr:hypothetical protein [Candidatus Pacearchaeota archaeon]
MKQYKVEVRDLGKLIFFKDKKIRSPFVLEMTERDIGLFKRTMAANGVEKYEIKEIGETDSDDFDNEIVVFDEDKEVVIEDMFVEEKEPSTILEKLLRDDKNGE